MNYLVENIHFNKANLFSVIQFSEVTSFCINDKFNFNRYHRTILILRIWHVEINSHNQAGIIYISLSSLTRKNCNREIIEQGKNCTYKKW